MTQPKVSHYCEWLRRNDHHGKYNYTYDEKSNVLLDELFTLIEQISPTAENGARTLWLRAERGPIEDYGIAAEEVEEGNFDSEEEFIEFWKEMFPEEIEWYCLGAVELKKEGYRAIALQHHFVIVQDSSRTQDGFVCEIAEFVQWMIDGVKECIGMLKTGVYNDFVREYLPAQHRTGTIQRQDFWNVWPDSRERFFEKISVEDRNEFISRASQQRDDRSSVGRMDAVTANDFFRFCAMGYAENGYDGCDKTPREQYFLHADGRDNGLGEIEADKPEAFREWLHDRTRFGGHPWEVCRGGNSTHVDLRIMEDTDGYYLYLAGSALTRTIETVKFYLALTRAGIPVILDEAHMLVERLCERERIGIVPEGVFPVYCASYFPTEHIIAYMNLPYEDREKFVPYCTWHEEPEISLLPQKGKPNERRT